MANLITNVEREHKATVRSVMVRSLAEADSMKDIVTVKDRASLERGLRLAVADVFYKGRHFHVEVPVGATESEMDTLRLVKEAICQKAKAVPLQDPYDLARIR